MVTEPDYGSDVAGIATTATSVDGGYVVDGVKTWATPALSVTTLTALDFLGFGLPPGSPSLGELLQQGKSNLQAPWLGLSGFIVIALMLSLLVFVGEAVRDAFDPRKLYAR